MRYAARHPERLEGLILCCGAAVFDYVADLQAGLSERATPEQLSALGEALTIREQDDESFRRRSLELLPLYFARPLAAAREEIANQLSFRARPFDLFKAAVLPSFDARPDLSAIRQPTLVVAGGRDLIVPSAACRQLLAIPGATHIELSESGHFPFVEQRDAFLAGIELWLDRLDGAVPATPGLA